MQVSIAKGHPRSATDNYKRTLAKVDFNEEDYNKGLCLPNTPFVIQTVEQLVSLLRKAKGILDAT